MKKLIILVLGISLIILSGCIAQLTEAEDLNVSLNADGTYNVQYLDATYKIRDVDMNGISLWHLNDTNTTCLRLGDGTTFCNESDLNKLFQASIDVNGLSEADGNSLWVPYVGADADVELGNHDLNANVINVDTIEVTDLVIGTIWGEQLGLGAAIGHDGTDWYFHDDILLSERKIKMGNSVIAQLTPAYGVFFNNTRAGDWNFGFNKTIHTDGNVMADANYLCDLTTCYLISDLATDTDTDTHISEAEWDANFNTRFQTDFDGNFNKRFTSDFDSNFGQKNLDALLNVTEVGVDTNKVLKYDGNSWLPMVDAWEGGTGSGDVNGQDINARWLNTETNLCIGSDCISAWSDVNVAGSGDLLESDANAMYVPILNPTSNGDTVIKINDGGTIRTAIQIEGAEGSVTFPRQPHVVAYRAIDQTIAHNTITTVVFDSEYRDVLGEFNTATGYFTAKDAGVYVFSTCIGWVSTNANIDYHTEIDTSTLTGDFRYRWEDSSANTYAPQCFSASDYLGAGGTARVWAYQISGGNETIRGGAGDAQTYFTVSKVA